MLNFILRFKRSLQNLLDFYISRSSFEGSTYNKIEKETEHFHRNNWELIKPSLKMQTTDKQGQLLIGLITNRKETRCLRKRIQNLFHLKANFDKMKKIR